MNLFLPVYKRIEEEVIKLTDTVFFNDKQLNVYSLTIGNLLIRTVIEVEAISKELYVRLGGVEHPVDANGDSRELYFDTDCIKLLVDKWEINKKKVQISNPNMFFSSEKSVLTPLHKAHKRGASSSRWQQAYQAVKHYRTKSIEKATIDNLLNALGALYILNLYYADESFWVETAIKDRREYTVESKIFTPFIADATHFKMGIDMCDSKIEAIENPTLEESIFILKNTEKAIKDIFTVLCKFNIAIRTKLEMSEEYKAYIMNHPEDANLGIESICKKLGVNYERFIAQEATLLEKLFSNLKHKEVVLNKNNEIYPTLTYSDFIESDEGQKYKQDIIASLDGKKIVLPKY